jgi:cell division protein FtsB
LSPIALFVLSFFQSAVKRICTRTVAVGHRRTLSGMDRQIRDDNTTPGRGGKPVVPSRRRSVMTFILLLVALALVLDGIAGDGGWIANRHDNRQLEQIELGLAAKRLENAGLRELVHRLQNQDPATIEDLARKELGFIRPGEKVFIIRDVPKLTR